MANLMILRWFIFSMAVAFPSIGSAVEISFESVRKYVLENNDRVKVHRKLAEAAKERQGHLLRSYLPRVKGHIGYEDFDVGTSISESQPFYGMEASINLFNGGRDLLEDEVRKLKFERREIESLVVVATEVVMAREIFWNLLHDRETLRLISEMQTINQANSIEARRRIRSGLATKSDQLEFTMKALSLKKEKLELESQLETSTRKLAILTGFNPDENIVLKGRLTHKDEWEQELKHSHEEHEFFVKPYELRRQEAEMISEKKARAWLPQLEAYAGWNQLNQRHEDPEESRERQESFMGVRVSMQLFDGLRSRSERRALLAEARAAQFKRDYKRKTNEVHIEKEFLELKTLHQMVHDADKNIGLARRYFVVTQSEYKRGAKNSLDMLGASEKLENATRHRNRLLRDFHIARSHVLAKVGK
jgi:outer membrane protein